MALISVRNRFESFMEQRYPDLSLQVKGNIGAFNEGSTWHQD